MHVYSRDQSLQFEYYRPMSSATPLLSLPFHFQSLSQTF